MWVGLSRVYGVLVFVLLLCLLGAAVAEEREAVLVDDRLLPEVLEEHARDLDEIIAGEAGESLTLETAAAYERLSEQLFELDVRYVEDGLEPTCSLFLINLDARQMSQRLPDIHACHAEGCSENLREAIVREVARLKQKMAEEADGCEVRTRTSATH